MLKNKKQQIFSSNNNNTDSNQQLLNKQDNINRERVINCNLKIMDNILLSQSDKEETTSSNHHNQYDDDDIDDIDDEGGGDDTNDSELFCYKTKLLNNNNNNNNNKLKIKSGHVSTSRMDQIGIINSKFNKQLNMIDIVDDQFDDDYATYHNNKQHHHHNHNHNHHKTENDYLQMAIHYKNLCKSYKKQLIESHKTIRELHLTLEVMERKNWTQKQQKSSLQIKRFESEENMKLTIEKCRVYCEKINRLTASTTTTQVQQEKEEETDQNITEEFILNTLKNTFYEKKEIKSFSKTFTTLINYLNPNSKELDSIRRLQEINYSSLKNVLNETLDYIKYNSPKNFHCKCNGAFEFERQQQQQLQIANKSTSSSTLKYIDAKKELCLISSSTAPSPSSLSSSSCSVSTTSSLCSFNQSNHNNHSHQNTDNYYRHQPSIEFLLKCVHLIQDLFDVECFQSIPTKLNDVYYKLGQLTNFKKAIQNIFDPNENYTIEKLVCAVQTIHSQLNNQISNNLSHLLHSTNLQNVVDKFNMYDEYFPLFRELLDQIMKTLEISRLDQIMPSIRALKILATPTLS